MNILRKKRKNNIKVRLKRIILLIFSLIMTTFAWITYSRILNSDVQIDINSWDLSFYVDKNQNNIAEESEEQENPISVDLSDLYPGMEEKIVKVIIRNNGDTATDILYTSSEINILGNEYTIVNTVPEDNEYYILKHDPDIGDNGITTVDFINEPERFPFKITIEHTQEILAGAEGFLNIKVTWPLYNENDTDEEKERKDVLDTKWGYQVAKYLEDNKDNPNVTGAFHAKVRINAIGKPRVDYNDYFIFKATPENYGDLVNYPIDLDDNEGTPDWKVFYNNGKNVYLIAADYMYNKKIPSQTLTDLYMATEAGQPYYIHFPVDDENGNDLRLYNRLIDDDIIQKFMLSKMNKFDTNNWNYKQTSALVDTEKWSFLVDNTYADSAVGASSIEMYVESWNAKGYTQLDTDTGKVGYLIGKKGDNLKEIAVDTNINGGYQIDLSSDVGYNDPLYYPTHSMENSTKTGYILAAPSAIGTTGHSMLYIRFDGKIYRTFYKNSPLGLRPVICLKTNVIGDKDETTGVWDLRISDLTANVNYSTTEETEEAVRVAITTNKELSKIPEDWNYTDENTKTEIYKLYSENATEYPLITDIDGFQTTVEVKVKNIKAKSLLSYVIGNESTMYGAYTNYPIDIDNNLEDNDWRIFYADDNQVYLIADDYVLNSKLPLSEIGMTANGKYSACWKKPASLGLTMDVNSKYFTMKDETSNFTSTFRSDLKSYQAAASLLDTSKWTSFVDTEHATDAIGSPTVEMWMSSWNKLYPDDTLYCNNGNDQGYFLGITPEPTGTNIAYDVMGSFEGYNNTLYYPHQRKIDECTGYYLSSMPGEHIAALMVVDRFAHIDDDNGFLQDTSTYTTALRPIIALKNGIKAVKNGEVWDLSN